MTNTSQTVLSAAVRNTTSAMNQIVKAVALGAYGDRAEAARHLKDGIALARDLLRNLEFAEIELAMAADREAKEAALKGEATVIMRELAAGGGKAAAS